MFELCFSSLIVSNVCYDLLVVSLTLFFCRVPRRRRVRGGIGMGGVPGDNLLVLVFPELVYKIVQFLSTYFSSNCQNTLRALAR